MIAALREGDSPRAAALMAEHLEAVVGRALRGDAEPEPASLSQTLARYAPATVE